MEMGNADFGMREISACRHAWGSVPFLQSSLNALTSRVRRRSGESRNEWVRTCNRFCVCVVVPEGSIDNFPQLVCLSKSRWRHRTEAHWPSPRRRVRDVACGVRCPGLRREACGDGEGEVERRTRVQTWQRPFAAAEKRISAGRMLYVFAVLSVPDKPLENPLQFFLTLPLPTLRQSPSSILEVEKVRVDVGIGRRSVDQPRGGFEVSRKAREPVVIAIHFWTGNPKFSKFSRIRYTKSTLRTCGAGESKGSRDDVVVTTKSLVLEPTKYDRSSTASHRESATSVPRDAVPDAGGLLGIEAKVGEGVAEEGECRGGPFAKITSRGSAGRCSSHWFMLGWLRCFGRREGSFVTASGLVNSEGAVRFAGSSSEPVLEWV
ncbi:hypothetical protein HPB50_002764 [Hyalomma asiaticum]|uniref:Uncharacterized protein n=1 Tax=Hyalomma asiaticum TaxID=266040 RepID=A0ACB7S6I3_HYAAI|nr:hypothetical protein HPB50_002764 [Hyalomma asiaticum]